MDQPPAAPQRHRKFRCTLLPNSVAVQSKMYQRLELPQNPCEHPRARIADAVATQVKTCQSLALTQRCAQFCFHEL
eukprot:1742260-Rhodomonas_salina.1